MPRKQIVQFDAASSVASTDRTLLQQGAAGTEFTHATISQILNAGLPATFSNATLSGNLTQSRVGTISAAGTSQATATTLTADINIVTTVSAGQGVILSDKDALVLNRGTVALLLYPTSGAQIEAFGTNAAVTLVAGTGSAELLRSSSTLFRLV